VDKAWFATSARQGGWCRSRSVSSWENIRSRSPLGSWRSQ
jgi:hypothetical protein